MWTVIVTALVLAVLVAFVWRQLVRHTPSPGRFTDAESRRQQRGSYWGEAGGGGGGA